MAKITIRDVAREAGVSTQTISRVTNNKDEITPETRARVQQVIDRLGYNPSRVARGLASQRTRTLGVIVSDITNPFYADLITSIQETAWELDYAVFQIITMNDIERERTAIQRLVNQQVDGIICCRSRLMSEELCRLVKPFKAAVFANRDVPCSGLGSVCHDNKCAMELAVEHLISVGCQRIAFLAGRRNLYYDNVRISAYEDALKVSSLPYEPEILNLDFEWSTEWLQCGLEIDENIQREFSSHPNFDGLICYNDVFAIGAIRALEKIGRRVPQDVAVVGIDDIRMGRFITPALTTLRPKTHELGVAVVRMVVDQIEGRGEAREILLPYELVVRESTARPKSNFSLPVD